MDYKNFETGLAESRAKWIQRWLKEKLEEGAVLVQEFREALGRLGFSAGAIETWRPFLGPLYAWTSVVPARSYLQIPVMIKIIMRYLVEEIEEGHYRVPADAEDGEEVPQDVSYEEQLVVSRGPARSRDGLADNVEG